MLDIRVGGYRIIERLAKGGMGEVYLARHEIMNREAAVKVLHPELGDKPELVERFLNEARAAASIRHPGIVEIYDVGHVDGRAYIVMEYLRGELLAQRVARTRIDVDKALLLTRQLAGALGAAHACGIIHRDLKPENVFVVPDPDVLGGERTKILDFGIAKLMESQAGVHTMQGAMFGTPAYMAPEQCQDAGQVDRRADLYALGCMLYELLSGTPPFGHGGIELVAAHLRDQPVPLRRRVAGLSESLEAVVMRLLAKDPEQRFPTCEALVRALDQVQAEQSGLPSLSLVPTDAASAYASAPSAISGSTPVPRGPSANARAVSAAFADTAAPLVAGHASHAAAHAGTSQGPGAGPRSAPISGPISGPTPAPASGATPVPTSGSLPGPVAGPMVASMAGQTTGSTPAPTHGTTSLPPAEMAGPVLLAAPAGGPRSRWLFGLVAFAALLVAGAAGFWFLRVAPAATPVAVDAAVPVDASAVDAPDAGLDVQILLARAREAYEREGWEEVLKLTREIMVRSERRSPLWQEARELRERVRGEEQYADTFQRLEQALAEGKIVAAVEHYKGLPGESKSHAEAVELWDRWVAEQFQAAEQNAREGQCTKLEEIETRLRQAAVTFAIVMDSFDRLKTRCRQRRRDDRDRDGPGQGNGQTPGGQQPGGGNQTPGGQEPGGGNQTPGGQEPGGQTPGGQEPGGGNQTPGGQEPGGQTPGGQEPGGGGQTPGGQEPGGQEPGGQEPGGQEPGGGEEPGSEPQALRAAGQALALTAGDGRLPRVTVLRLRRRLADCATEGNVRGQFTVRVEVGARRKIDSITVEPQQDALDRCARKMAGERVAAQPGTYRSSVQLP